MAKLTMIILHVKIRRRVPTRNDSLHSLESFNLLSLSFSLNFECFDIFAREQLPILDVALLLRIHSLDVVLDSLVAFEVSEGAEVLPRV